MRAFELTPENNGHTCRFTTSAKVSLQTSPILSYLFQFPPNCSHAKPTLSSFSHFISQTCITPKSTMTVTEHLAKEPVYV